MSPLELAVNEMIVGIHPIHRAMIDYTQSCRAHRLSQIGWEDSINELNADELLFLALKMHPHQRLGIFKKIRHLNNAPICDLMDKHNVGTEDLNHVS
jgi:hypothetical protein